MSRIGKNIKKARAEKGYTQEQLAQKLNVTRNTISNYETGHSNPDIEMLQMLAEALETDPNTLIYGEKKNQSVDQAFGLFSSCHSICKNCYSFCSFVD